MTQLPESERILIFDFGSQYGQLIARRVREAGVYCEILPFQAVDGAKIKAFDPRGIILSGGPSTGAGPDPFVYFVQVGAFTRTEEAEQQRAKLAMNGYAAKITEREQSGRTVYRVRVGPYESRDEADGVQARLQEANVEARLVRVERP